MLLPFRKRRGIRIHIHIHMIYIHTPHSSSNTSSRSCRCLCMRKQRMCLRSPLRILTRIMSWWGPMSMSSASWMRHFLHNHHRWVRVRVRAPSRVQAQVRRAVRISRHRLRSVRNHPPLRHRRDGRMRTRSMGRTTIKANQRFLRLLQYRRPILRALPTLPRTPPLLSLPLLLLTPPPTLVPPAPSYRNNSNKKLHHPTRI